jgi:hypothetical protein
MSFLPRFDAAGKPRPAPAPVSHGDPSAAWDFIGELAELAAVQSDLIRYCAERGDKAGAAFGARRLRACVRAIGETIKEELS